MVQEAIQYLADQVRSEQTNHMPLAVILCACAVSPCVSCRVVASIFAPFLTLVHCAPLSPRVDLFLHVASE